jgi:hypothetical protein
VMKARKWLPLVTALGLAAAYGAPFLLTYSEQDDCNFGPVTSERYRDYLRRARNLYSSQPNEFSWNHQEASVLLNKLFEQLVDQNPSVYERVAASHAPLRTLGAQYRNTNDMRNPDPYAATARHGVFVNFEYLLDVNRLGLFSPFKRDAWIIAQLTGPGERYRGPIPLKPGDIRFVVNYPALEPREIKRAPEQCPPVPNQALSESFSLSTK